jgi:molybdopterin-guanine dinucleotide biosynthesis protein A
LPPDLVARLEAAARGTRGIAVARCGTAAHQVCSLWPITLSLALRGWLETGRSRKVMDFIVEGPHGFADFPAMQTPQGAIDPFFNINTPDDLARAEVITAGMVQ